MWTAEQYTGSSGVSDSFHWMIYLKLFHHFSVLKEKRTQNLAHFNTAGLGDLQRIV